MMITRIRSKTHHIINWEDWKELCEKYEIDPYEEIEFGFDLGGGNSEDFEFIGEIPIKERQNE